MKQREIGKAEMSNVIKHLDQVAHEAGLEVMDSAGILGIVLNREEVSDERLMALTATDLTDLYYTFVGPMIDDIERRLREADGVSVNGHLDYGTGFIDSGIADALAERFGVFPQFGSAGGCINMLLELDSGLAVHINDAEDAGLTPVKKRSVAEGFNVAVYRNQDAAGWGEDPKVTLTRYVDVAGLGDLIADAVRAYNTAQAL